MVGGVQAYFRLTGWWFPVVVLWDLQLQDLGRTRWLLQRMGRGEL